MGEGKDREGNEKDGLEGGRATNGKKDGKPRGRRNGRWWDGQRGKMRQKELKAPCTD